MGSGAAAPCPVWHTFDMISRDRLPEDEIRGSGPADAEDAGRSDQPPGGDAGADDAPKEIGGRKGPDPTRYGDWEKAGRCIDF